MIINLNLHLIPILLNLPHSFMRQFQLMSQMVNMSLQSFYFWNIILFFLLKLFYLELGTAHVLFVVHALLIQFVVVIGDLLYCFLVPLRFDTGVTVVLEDVLLFHFEGSKALLGETLLVLKLLVLSLKEFVCLSCFCKFTVDKLVLSGKSLDIFG